MSASVVALILFRKAWDLVIELIKQIIIDPMRK